MNKIGDIYPEIIAKENLYRSAHMASRGRRYNNTTADFNFFLEEELESLHNELTRKQYHHGEYRIFTIYDPKEREISAAPFRDRVVHHAVNDIIEPLIDKTFIYDSYACRKDKGTHKAVDRAQSFLRANKFCLHGDIKKYFYSINHDILKGILKKRIEDKDLLWLLDEIVDSAVLVNRLAGVPVSGLAGEPVSELAGVPVSGLASKPVNRYTGTLENQRKGLPIGNLTSQFFANLYLNELDYFVKFKLRHRYYIRYMDDFLFFSNNKEQLIGIKKEIRDFLKSNLALDLHKDKSQIYKTKNGLKFLGFRIFKDYRKLTSDNVRRFRNRLKGFAYLFENDRIEVNKIRDSVRCWVAHSKYANTKTLRYTIWDALTAKNIALGNSLKDILSEPVSGFTGEPVSGL